jgi:DNA polymerase I-like protein with 3'-5' exonuclease and polymerase domains
MSRFIFDMECDALLDDVTKIHVIGWHNLETGKSGTITDYKRMKRFLLQSNLTLICHNAIRFDIPIFEKILKIEIIARVIDTLAISWYLKPMRESHGLAGYGEDFGVPKPIVLKNEWLGPLPDETQEQFDKKMAHRVSEDVKINLHLFRHQLKHLKEIYDDTKVMTNFINYLMFKMQCAKEQEDVKWKLDIPKCTLNLNNFESEFVRKQHELSDLMPQNIIYKTMKKPKIMHKKDESFSKRGENWLSLLAELGLEEDTQELKIEKLRETGNPNSHKQLKEWLFELGWIPITFKYDKDENGKVRRIPQVSLPRGEGLCSSVKLLYEVEPHLEELDMLYVIKHRIGILKGFLRDEKDGYLQAKIAGLTNTLRFKHSVIVNLPGYTGKGDWRDGEHIRGCLIAEEGYVLCGSDMSSLENRTGEHYMYYFDPDYVKERNSVGFDSHTDMAVTAKLMTKREEELFKELDVRSHLTSLHKDSLTSEEKVIFTALKKVRASAKTVNYSAIYGVGAPKMNLSTGMPLEKCVILLKAYWKRNWSVKEVGKSCVTKEVYGDKWLWNPVSKFWYSLRAMKDRFSTLNQGTGVYAFDRWVMKCRNSGLKMCGQFHDEVVTPTLKGRETQTESILRVAIEEVNLELKLNRALDIDVQFGNSYAEIH